MSDNIKILIKSLVWFTTLFFIIFIGVNNVLAEEQKTGLGFLNNSNVVISNKKGVDIQLSRNVANTVNFDIKQIIFSSTYNLQANTVYEYEIETYNQYLKNIDEVKILSSNGICTFLGLSGLNSSYVRVKFTCSSATSTFTLSLSNSNDNNITNSYNIRWSTIYLWSIIDTVDLGPIINNQTQNTQNIINNNNDNTQNIINNNNDNTQKIIDENKNLYLSCKNEVIRLNSSNSTIGKYLDEFGDEISSSSYAITDYFMTNEKFKLLLTVNTGDLSNVSHSSYRACFYNDKKDLITCNYLGDLISWEGTSQTMNIDIPDNTSYFRISYRHNIARLSNTLDYTKCVNKLDEQKDAIDNVNDTLKDDDTTGAESEASEFFSSFDTETFGLTSIITAPLNLIRSVLSSTCTDLQLPLPYLDNKKLTLPCMSSIYSQFFGSFFTIYQTITYGIIAYWVCVRIFNQVKDFKNPEHDEIEVMDL